MSGRRMTGRSAIRAFFLAGILAAGRCITINIYFPAAAAERAADRIIDQVWQQGGAPSKPDAPAAAPQEAK